MSIVEYIRRLFFVLVTANGRFGNLIRGAVETRNWIPSRFVVDGRVRGRVGRHAKGETGRLDRITEGGRDLSCSSFGKNKVRGAGLRGGNEGQT